MWFLVAGFLISIGLGYHLGYEDAKKHNEIFKQAVETPPTPSAPSLHSM